MRTFQFVFAATLLLLGCEQPAAGSHPAQAALPSSRHTSSSLQAPTEAINPSSQAARREKEKVAAASSSSSSAVVKASLSVPSESSQATSESVTSAAFSVSSIALVPSSSSESAHSSVHSVATSLEARNTEVASTVESISADSIQSSVQSAMSSSAENSSVDEVAAAVSSAPSSAASVSPVSTRSDANSSESILLSNSSSKATMSGIEQTAPASVAVEPPLHLTGSSRIDFGSRGTSSEQGSDTYSLRLSIDTMLSVDGTVVRKPRVVSAILGREKSPEELAFDLKFVITHPESHAVMNAGSLSGVMPISKEGTYSPATGKPRLTITSSVKPERGGLSGVFGGTIKGKAAESKGLLREYTRWIGGKKISYRAQHTDPLEFKTLILGAGPLEIYPEVTVSGRLDYDYDTGNWITDGITMRYRVGSEVKSDVITGSIKWEEDPDRATNGKGSYQFNLRFNDKPQEASDESAFFASANDESAFFAVDPSTPNLSGSVSYRDTFGPAKDGDEPVVIRSTVTYNLDGNHLTKTQMVNFLKLWLLLTGPVNDD